MFRFFVAYPKTILMWAVTFLILVCSVKIALADENTVPVQTIIGEARGESEMGQIAVGNVIRNRAKMRRWSDETFEGICLAPWQFSFWNEPKDALRTLARVSGETWQKCANAWALSENVNYVGKATLYCRWDCWPEWRASKKVKFVRRIGNHVFYQEL